MEAKVIENYLKTVDQAAFQSLMNHLLYLEGYHFVGAPGSVIGKNKTSKGAPDSFFADGDKFIFCEYTTKDRLLNAKTFFEKLESDIEHCFDTSDTGIPKDKISKIILGCTDEIQANELKLLKDQVEKHNSSSTLVTYTIQQIPIKLLYYPGLADRYIPGVKTTKGSIFTLPDFINTTKKGVQPSLENPFTGRATELLVVKQKLAVVDVLVLTGGQGVGKSKVAIQAASDMTAEGFEVRIISASPVALWDDLQYYLWPNKKYILVFDDANKALPNLEYLLQFIKDRPDGRIKLILTVRDYVKHDLNKYLIDTVYDSLELITQNSTQLRAMLEAAVPSGLRIDPAYLEQMTTIAKGNARLAMMALLSALNGAKRNYLQNVEGLYEYYFKKLESEMAIISDALKLKALGILAFFDKLDFCYGPLKATLADDFKIDLDEVRETLLELERSELVDFFSNEICRMSDQVLSTYVFYKTFLDPKSSVIDYAEWLCIFFTSAEQRVRRTLVDLNNTFGHPHTKTLVLPHLQRFRETIKKDDAALAKFYEMFWAYLEADTLAFTGRQIDTLPEPATEVMNAALTKLGEREFFIPSDQIELLKHFWRNPTGFATEALRLGLRLLLKEPGRTTEMTEALQEGFKFNRFDHRNEYERQSVFLDWLCAPTTTVAETIILEHIFLQFVTTLFNWEFFELTNNGLEHIMHTICLRKLPGLVAIRRKALIHIFALASRGHVSAARDLMNKYLRPGQGFDNTLYADEADLVLPFMAANYSPQVYADIEFVAEYLALIEAQGIAIPATFSTFRNNLLITTADRLLFRASDFTGGDFDEREREKRAAMAALAQGKDLRGIKEFFVQAEQLYQQGGNTGNNHWIELSMSFFIEAISDANPPLFLEAMRDIIGAGYHFARNLHSVIGYPLFKGITANDFYNILNGADYEQKAFWKQLFFEHLPQTVITAFYLKEFVTFLQRLQGGANFRELDFLKKYQTIYQSDRKNLPNIGTDLDNIYTYITQILLTKAATINIGLDRHVGEKFGAFFTKRPDLLRQAYDYQRKKDKDFDPHGLELKILLQYDPTSILDELRRELAAPGFNESRLYKYDLIWDLPDPAPLLDEAINIVIQKSSFLMNSDHFINAFFKKRQQPADKRAQALDYIRSYIERHINVKRDIVFIFNVVTYSYTTELLPMLRHFLLLNHDASFIEGLELEKSDVFHGDAVPIIETEIDLYEQVLVMTRSLPDTMRYAGHIAYWEKHIEGLKASRTAAKLHNFTGPR